MWQPGLRQGAKPLHDQLIDALARDIASGALAPGAQLPPQRDLAYKLKIGVGTVTKVYAEARRRGLLTATVGRGSFVAGPALAADDHDTTIDFSRNVSPMTAAASHLSDALDAIRRRPDASACTAKQAPSG
jgi:DNA-binding transcriptional regulator YhcF (GntR family)